jgi:hypothetical protein
MSPNLDVMIQPTNADAIPIKELKLMEAMYVMDPPCLGLVSPRDISPFALMETHKHPEHTDRSCPILHLAM